MEKLQESKADKENVAMEMNIKADKAALESKVNVSTFDNTFSMLDEGLREALQKMDDYMNEEMALKQALKQLSVDMSEKMDGQAFQALKNYLGRCPTLTNSYRVETFWNLSWYRRHSGPKTGNGRTEGQENYCNVSFPRLFVLLLSIVLGQLSLLH